MSKQVKPFEPFEPCQICICNIESSKFGIHMHNCPLYPNCRLCGKPHNLCKMLNHCAGIRKIGNLALFDNNMKRHLLNVMSSLNIKFIEVNSIFFELYQTGRLDQSTFLNWNRRVSQFQAAYQKKEPTLADVKNAEKILLCMRRFYIDAKTESEKPIAPQQKVQDDSGPLARSND